MATVCFVTPGVVPVPAGDGRPGVAADGPAVPLPLRAGALESSRVEVASEGVPATPLPDPLGWVAVGPLGGTGRPGERGPAAGADSPVGVRGSVGDELLSLNGTFPPRSISAPVTTRRVGPGVVPGRPAV